MASIMEEKQLTVGILSMGDMGAGIARLLVAHDICVVTNCQGRSQDTVDRAVDAGAKLLESDTALVRESDIVLSVVPPRDAEATAKRVVQALRVLSRRGAQSGNSDSGSGSGSGHVAFYVDANAISPATSARIETMLPSSVRFVDACILGGPPRKTSDAADGTSSGMTTTTTSITPSITSDVVTPSTMPAVTTWQQPSIPISGPHAPSLPPALRTALQTRCIAGSASGLKICFAGLTKGFTALATQTLTTASQLGVGDDLQREMAALMPAQWAAVQRGVPSMPPKAYRWASEMDEIADTMLGDGGWDAGAAALFRGAADVYRAVAAHPTLGSERIGRRRCGLTADEVADALAQRQA